MNLLSEAFVTRIGRALLAALALILAASGPAQAQSTHIQPKLIAESPAPAPGVATTLALTMTPEKTWHGYWVTGGDSRFGLAFDCNQPEGVTLAPFRHPVPPPP